MNEDLIADYRRFFVEEIRALAALEPGEASARVLRAFGAVRRETFAGPGPWTLRSPLYGMVPRRTEDADPRHLCHCVLIALDEQRKINIGEPSLWARVLSRTDIPKGARVLQVGAGSGYYTAILNEIVPDGSVLAMETDERLAELASKALRDVDNVEMRHGNGATDLRGDDGPFDLVVAFAGVTHPVAAWIDRLAPAGRMLLPVTGVRWGGAMMLATPTDGGFDAITLGPCGFYPCAGARDDRLAERIDAMWQDRTRLDGWKMNIRTDDDRLRYIVDGQTF